MAFLGEAILSLCKVSRLQSRQGLGCAGYGFQHEARGHHALVDFREKQVTSRIIVGAGAGHGCRIGTRAKFRAVTGNHSQDQKSWGGRRDLNPRQPDPQSGALTRLSYGHQPADNLVFRSTVVKFSNPKGRSSRPPDFTFQPFPPPLRYLSCLL